MYNAAKVIREFFTVSNQITIYEVTAFSDDATSGSPTGVVFNSVDLSDIQMQSIAGQLNVSHTAFVRESGENEVSIRFFTPQCEINNCGHATIAAHWLRHALNEDNSTTTIQRTRKGIQEVNIHHKNDKISVHFKQNEIAFTSIDADILSELLAALNITSDDLNHTYPVILASPGAERFLVGLQSPDTLKTLKPDISRVRKLCERNNAIGCFVYTIDPESSSTQAHGRMFAPAIGIDEDIINGNSSGCLGAYLIHLDSACNELVLNVHQGMTARRPGTVMVNARRHQGKIVTRIGGTATLLSERQIMLDSRQ